MKAYVPGVAKVRTGGGVQALSGMPEVEALNDYGQVQEVRLSGEPQAFLHRLIARTTVYHFEVTRPSLHDIFVRIARPEEQQTGAP